MRPLAFFLLLALASLFLACKSSDPTPAVTTTGANNGQTPLESSSVNPDGDWSASWRYESELRGLAEKPVARACKDEAQNKMESFLCINNESRGIGIWVVFHSSTPSYADFTATDCGDRCTIVLKFDERPVLTVQAEEKTRRLLFFALNGDGYYNTKLNSRIVREIANSSTLQIEVPLEDYRREILRFDLDGFDLDRLKLPKK